MDEQQKEPADLGNLGISTVVLINGKLYFIAGYQVDNVHGRVQLDLQSDPGPRAM